MIIEIATYTKGYKTRTTKLALGRSSIVVKITTYLKDTKYTYKNNSLLEII
jgi:hypothetical protein